eukprot:1438873-Rhodomonas_salina.1
MTLGIPTSMYPGTPGSIQKMRRKESKGRKKVDILATVTSEETLLVLLLVLLVLAVAGGSRMLVL